MHRKLVAVAFAALAGCTTIDRGTLIEGVAEARRMEDIDVTVRELPFFEAHYECVSRIGFVFMLLPPPLLLVPACATTPRDSELDGRPWCEVITSDATNNALMEHELAHCQGYAH